MRNWFLAFLSAVCLLFVEAAGSAQSKPAATPVGFWTTIDDETGKPKAVVKIAARGKQLHGVIVKLLQREDQNAKCDECSGSKKDKPVLGMEIIWGLEKDGDEWSGGRILDPGNGKEYSCYISLEDGGKQLKVRGYLGIALLGRTQYWKRAAAP